MLHWLDKTRSSGCWAATLPLLGFVVLLFVGKRMGRAAGWSARRRSRGRRRGAVRPPAGAAAATRRRPDLLIPWLTLSPQSMVVSIGVHVDGLTIAMCAMVTVVATMIHLFSIGYMADDTRYRPVLRLPEPVLLLDARAGAGQHAAVAVHLLGTGRAVLVPADRLLVREEVARPTRPSRRSWSTASATSASCSGWPGRSCWLAPSGASGTTGAPMNLTIAQMAEIGQALIASRGGAAGAG